ncbi:dihydrofolate reductase [Metasolibacillus sp.]|uniref:dihydrofolate reductase n=1 Tax=Metasolibacillus sp. TaxID=2703680 RepID=UPI0025F0148F|nr:dihydrofolate reductase [Metasolibacillus sp.]MCT6926239.1 dihydrofolate reductase [Metasolibacillus sp.]MCT6942493.1 dihydrofolate reductase [Metasolibacillus sp.]
MISLIVAHDKNRVIGYKNEMPWHLPGDLKYFKEMTMGKPVIMGRKTFESIGKALPGRRNIVITRNAAYVADNIEVVGSLEEALALVQDEPEIMVIGGEQIFKLALALADRLYITEIDYAFEGDTYFPAYEGWQLVSEREPVQAKEGYFFTYCIYEK